ncbi:MAG: hypothetical protein CL694_03295 [Chloroflexi bacterium]|nr:hypothetical protein [Chloroflexota bacterium]HAL48999.1 hypothetical protein [Dehalococcoidia bacterium]
MIAACPVPSTEDGDRPRHRLLVLREDRRFAVVPTRRMAPGGHRQVGDRIMPERASLPYDNGIERFRKTKSNEEQQWQLAM